MSRWVLVPSEPTEGMVKAAKYARQNDQDGTARMTYRAMLAASPDPSKDEELVERVAGAIAAILAKSQTVAYPVDSPWLTGPCILAARAILSLFTEKGDG